MRTRFLLIGLLTVGLFTTCKDKLEGDRSILVGNWKWVYTEEYLDPNAFMTGNLEAVIQADSFSVAYRMEFQEKGKLIRWQDEEETRDRIVIKTFEAASPTWFVIRIQPDGKNKKELNMDLIDRGVDTLIVDEYPFNDVHDGNGRTYYHRNYFVRQ